MEPQWNPAVEEQALARVHRLGQERDVTTVRLVIDESIEKGELSGPSEMIILGLAKQGDQPGGQGGTSNQQANS